jgi:uncharacterized protein (TIGR02117 family)
LIIFVKRFATILITMISALLLLGVAGMLVPRPFTGGLTLAVPKDENDTSPELQTILLIKNPIHTDIAFPNDPEIREKFRFALKDGLPLENPEARWIVVGWGGRSFFIETPTWADIKPMPVLRALTIDSSVMHVMATGQLNDAENVRAISMPVLQFENLLAAALKGFKRGEDGQPILIKGAAYGRFDQFYEGVGSFNALVGCNTWTASVLRAGGIRTGWWNPLPYSLMTSLELWNRCAENDDYCVNAL